MISVMLEAAVRALALGVAVWLVLLVSRTRNVHLQKTVWTVVLVAAATMPLLMQARVAPVIQAPDYLVVLQGSSRGAAAAPVAVAWGTVLYLLVAAVLLVRYAGNLVRMWRVRSRARKLDDIMGDVRVSASIASPATFGSTILLPADCATWSEQKMRFVLSHEGSHVRQRDCYVLWLARLYTSVFWFNPLAWWLQRRLALLAETTSDEAAVAALDDPPGYAAILLEFAHRRAAGPAATAMASTNLSTRIERIISGDAPSPMPTVLRRALSIAAVLSVALAMAVPLRTAAADADAGVPQPQITQPVSIEELKQYYPPEALHQGINGIVKILVTLDKQGRATDTLVLSEDPQDMGFGAAASTIAHHMGYSNPTGRAAQLSFNVKFQLPQQ
jgi:beta-lactamase regulating signal transducer with metallopeptidase domain